MADIINRIQRNDISAIMENKPTAPNGNDTVASLPRREYEVCKALTVFNQLRAFKLDLNEVLMWKDTVLRIRPDVELEALKLAVDGLISGDIPYDEKIGIKNIFIALKRVIRDEDGKLITLKPVY